MSTGRRFSQNTFKVSFETQFELIGGYFIMFVKLYNINCALLSRRLQYVLQINNSFCLLSYRNIGSHRWEMDDRNSTLEFTEGRKEPTPKCNLDR